MVGMDKCNMGRGFGLTIIDAEIPSQKTQNISSLSSLSSRCALSSPCCLKGPSQRLGCGQFCEFLAFEFLDGVEWSPLLGYL